MYEKDHPVGQKALDQTGSEKEAGRCRYQIQTLKGLIMQKCDGNTEVYSRVVGFFRPVENWNKGKKAEYKERTEFDVKETVNHE